MKRTAFYDIHKSLSARMVEFAGFEMPVQYDGIISEHMAVRNSVGVFDVSHMGEFFIIGKDALNLIQKCTTNDASRLSYGKVQYSAMCYHDGGIVDDLLVYCFGDYYMLVVNSANIDKDFSWLNDNAQGYDVKIEDRSNDFSLLAVQGRNSIHTLQKLTDTDLSSLKYYTFTEGKIAGENVIISRTGYTGESMGFELYFSSDRTVSEKIWNEIFRAGSEFNIRPAGLGARDTLRLEAGYCLYGNDINNTTNVIEAGLGWITKISKGNFNGRAAIEHVLADGPKRKLTGFIVEGRTPARRGYGIFKNGLRVGEITSGSLSPVLGKNIALGYVKPEYAVPGTMLKVKIRNDYTVAETAKPPFVQTSKDK